MNDADYGRYLKKFRPSTAAGIQAAKIKEKAQAADNRLDAARKKIREGLKQQRT